MGYSSEDIREMPLENDHGDLPDQKRAGREPAEGISLEQLQKQK